MNTRKEQFETLFPSEPAFRWKQIEQGLFSDATGWNELTSLSKTMREKIGEIPWMSVIQKHVQVSASGDTHKALLIVDREQEIETVLMKNRRQAWTICVSTQVGCAMQCAFCATGKMGLKRNLTSDEIIDQYRFWVRYINEHKLESRISNIVYMGMGEPLANYEAVKDSLNLILKHTDIGKTRITVSTVGVLPRLEQILDDDEWPHVRLAVSLHSAQTDVRKQIMPSSYDEFLPKLADWARRYLQKFGNRRHHLTFEYIMLKGVNDSPEHAKTLARYVKRIGNVRINLIPYNLTGVSFEKSSDLSINQFFSILQSHHVTVMTRKTMGDDIDAACGQLANKQKRKG